MDKGLLIISIIATMTMVTVVSIGIKLIRLNLEILKNQVSAAEAKTLDAQVHKAMADVLIGIDKKLEEK